MTRAKISLYDVSNIDHCPWPKNNDGELAKNFLEPLVKTGVNHYVENIETKYGVLLAFDKVLPITWNEEEYENSFICSPYSHYVSYSFFWVDQLKNTLAKSLILPCLKLYSGLMRRGKINKVIMVNNWLLTTNPAPDLTEEQLKELTEFLQKKFPEHAIIFRSITGDMCKDFHFALKESGYQMIPSRYMWLTKGDDESVFKTRIFKSDLKFIKEKSFEVLDHSNIDEADSKRLHELYKALYIKKYSTLNPQFNENFMRHLIKNRLLHLQVIKDGDEIEGVIGHHCQNGKMISPLFGYDPEKENKGVYRYLSTLLMLSAQKHKALFNQSAGGGFYKKIRRAYGDMEYTAVYYSHLPFKRRLPWNALSFVLNTFGVRAMKNYK